ncbi:hypothetical protein [Deinococcus aestuarii]|uniref:hypothetical protein n=1 Tax=Deinococcus aestuarii TaxID=2774531 RepID=UPI001C0ABE8A|nr:hypothetical protein [Deinococcus aestuarii]
MKKALMVLTGTLVLIGTASAGNVDSKVDAKVDNLCVYQTTSGSDVNTTANFKGADINLGQYRANAATTKENAAIVTVLCNRGTTLDRKFPATVNLKSNGSDDLVVKITDTTLPYSTGTQNNPDTWNVDVKLVAEAGQWNVKGGTFTGTLSVTLSYN